MTAGPDGSGVAMMECHRCHFEVPAGGFCGRCGAHLAEEPGDGPQWLRTGIFGAAPKERVLRPHVSSSLFPHLSARSRKAFGVAMAVGVVLLIGFALLRMPAAGITVAALGLPLMFALYLRAAKVDVDISRITLAGTAFLGALLGVAWVLVSGGLVAHTYGVPLGVGLALHHLIQAGFAIPTTGMLLMVVPAVIVRLRHPQDRESLDGFAIGALGALSFTAAATIARLAPQFATGLVVHHRPVKGLVVQAALCGVTIPVSAAAAGGLVGVWLWFRQRDSDNAGEHAHRVRLILGLLAAAALLAHAAVGTVDIIGLPQLWMLTIHTLLTLFVLLALRASLQLALLHEVPDPVREDEAILCVHCEMVVPDMPFCPACGVSAHASSKASRRERRGDSCPVPSASDSVRPESLEEYPGYAMPTGTYFAPRLRPTRSTWLLGRWGVVIATVTMAMGALALWLTPKIAHYMCPPDCGRPPTGIPVTALPRFSAPGGAFSVAYPAPGSAYTIDTQNAGVTATFTAGDGGVMQLFSEPANGRSARDITKAAIRKAYPDAKFGYEIPNAMVGYQPGYGEVADDWPQNSASTSSRVRILVMTAVKNDVALIAFATGPYHAFGPDFGPGPPSGANLQIAQDLGKYVNSFQWNGDPPR
ncbi:MAG: zinc ribbon domain-containing protein [Mycobacterium sp.]